MNLTPLSKMNGSKSTITHLPDDLQAIRKSLTTNIQINALNSIIDNARKGTFHCFKSKHATPKMILLSQLGLLMPATQKIIDDVKAGIYDEPINS